jgi:hypothetical protein
VLKALLFERRGTFLLKKTFAQKLKIQEELCLSICVSNDLLNQYLTLIQELDIAVSHLAITARNVCVSLKNVLVMCRTPRLMDVAF